jgi:hypothetical protein
MLMAVALAPIRRHEGEPPPYKDVEFMMISVE